MGQDLLLITGPVTAVLTWSHQQNLMFSTSKALDESSGAQRDAVHFRRIGLGDHCDAQRATRARELLDQQLRSLVHCAGMVALVRDDGMTAGLRFEDAVQTVA